MADEVETLEAVENTGAETSSVDDVFNDAPAVEQTAEPSQGDTVATPTEQVETVTEAAPPAAEDKRGLEAALVAERRRRQDAEARLRTQETKKAPDPIEDPDGYANHIESRSQQNEFSTRIAISRDLMIDANPDFESVEKVFMGLVVDEAGNITDESLFRKFQSAPNPARFAYNAAKEHLQVQELKSPAYRETLKAALRAEIEAEMKGKKSVVPAVPDLVTSTASGSNSSKVERLAEMDEIFEGSKL